MPPTTRIESGAIEGFLDISSIAPRVQGPRGADRGFIAGRSGAGKSFLARRLLTSYGIAASKGFRATIFIIDPNGNFDYPSERQFETVEEVRIDKKATVHRYVPALTELTADRWNALWAKLFLYDDYLMTYCDETRAMEPLFGRVRFPVGNFFTAYLTRGRALGKAAILGAQRPVLIPRDIIGQAEWFYVFDLPLEDDRKTIAGTIGTFSEEGERIDERETLGRYEFWFKGPEDITHTSRPVRAQIVR